MKFSDAPGKEWTFIETEADLETLMKWLNPRGEREMALHSVLTDCMEDIKAGIRKREEVGLLASLAGEVALSV